MTFTTITSISIDDDGTMQRTSVQSPAVLGKRMRVSIPADMDSALAAKLLRTLANELETQKGPKR